MDSHATSTRIQGFCFQQPNDSHLTILLLPILPRYLWTLSTKLTNLEVAKNAQKLKDRMLSFWKTIADKVPQKNYIIDFVVLDDRVLIIELNPWVRDDPFIRNLSS